MPSLQDLRNSVRTKRLKAYKLLHGRPMWTEHPVSLELDTQNSCSLCCSYCNPQNIFVKDHKILPLSCLDRLFEVLNQEKAFINYVCAFGNGDALLEPRLPVIAKKIKQKLGARVDVFTNGVIFGLRDVLHTPYLDDIRFTISASNPELYAKVHGKPLFKEAVKTLQWVTNNKFWHQRIWVNFVFFRDNAYDLANWQHLFRGYYHDVRPLHVGDDRETSKKFADANALVALRNEAVRERMIKAEMPCSTFHSLAVGADGNYLQCIDLDYKHNWGHIEEIDVLETYRKKLDLGLNHPGCKGCNQKNPHWKELFEKYVW